MDGKPLPLLLLLCEVLVVSRYLYPEGLQTLLWLSRLVNDGLGSIRQLGHENRFGSLYCFIIYFF